MGLCPEEQKSQHGVAGAGSECASACDKACSRAYLGADAGVSAGISRSFKEVAAARRLCPEGQTSQHGVTGACSGHAYR